jgi:hypothetical protein
MVFGSSDMALDYIAVSVAWSTNIFYIICLCFFHLYNCSTWAINLDILNGFIYCCCPNAVHFIMFLHHFLLGWFIDIFLPIVLQFSCFRIFLFLFIFVAIQIFSSVLVILILLSPNYDWKICLGLSMWLKCFVCLAKV